MNPDDKVNPEDQTTETEDELTDELVGDEVDD